MVVRNVCFLSRLVKRERFAEVLKHPVVSIQSTFVACQLGDIFKRYLATKRNAKR